ncbi:hypothetical protein DER45DRAFT_580864 [Fusarium avenaceum]|nr:hypothetical protein DER45DRAFT_580864 [Fusarium avenaceum]
MSHLMEDNKSNLSNGAARSYQRSQSLSAVSDYIALQAVYRAKRAGIRERLFKCDQCKHSFERNDNLKKHKRKVHGITDAFPSFSQEDDLMRRRFVTGCRPKGESSEERRDLGHSSRDILAKNCKPESDIVTEDRLPNSSSNTYWSNNASLELPSENGTQPQIANFETYLSEWIAETSTAPFLANYIQQHALPTLPELPDELESRGSSPTTQSDGSSNPTETYIDERKRQIIDRIVFNVAQWMRSMFHSCRKNAGDNSAGASGRPSESQEFSSKDRTSRSTKPSKQKRRLTKVDDDETDEDDEEEQKQNRQSGKKPSQDHENQKYACPYFKYNPTKYRDWRVCPGPGWADIHRVKEHLYRRHRQPKYRCGRCWEPFKDEQCYLDHLRTEEACPLREMEHVEGFDEAQERSLKSRKRYGRELSEDDKWRRVFKILFPHVLDDDVPSPFYEYHQTSQKGDNHQHSENDYLARCEDYMVREVPQRLRQALGRELDRDLTIVEESLRRKAGDWVKTLLEEAFRELRQNRGEDSQSRPGEEPSLPIAGPSSLASQEGNSANNNLPYEGHNEAWLSNFNLDSFDPFALLGESEFAFDNGGLLEDLLGPGGGGGGSDTGATREHSDSGYRSFSSMQYEKATGEQ